MESVVVLAGVVPTPSYEISCLRTPEDYRSSGRAHLFPSETSLRWFLRAHRDRLVQAGALSRIAGRLWINPVAFDEVVADVGRERAGQVA